MWTQQVSFITDLMTFSQSQCHYVRYEMIEIKAVYNTGRYERIWLKIMCVLPAAQVVSHDG